jgi:hypothetical protein
MVTVALLVAAVVAQIPDSGTPLRGRVVGENGAPIDGANVFILETLDGALSNAAGHFSIRTGHRGVATLVVRRVGFRPKQLDVSIPAAAPIAVTLEKQPVALAPVTVQAGRYTAGDERGATLTTLEVVTTPGAAADVNRAIQTLPGVQTVDEGTALFVRGGDYTETKVLLDERWGARLAPPAPHRPDSRRSPSPQRSRSRAPSDSACPATDSTSTRSSASIGATVATTRRPRATI